MGLEPGQRLIRHGFGNADEPIHLGQPRKPRGVEEGRTLAREGVGEKDGEQVIDERADPDPGPSKGLEGLGLDQDCLMVEVEAEEDIPPRGGHGFVLGIGPLAEAMQELACIEEPGPFGVGVDGLDLESSRGVRQKLAHDIPHDPLDSRFPVVEG